MAEQVHDLLKEHQTRVRTRAPTSSSAASAASISTARRCAAATRRHWRRPSCARLRFHDLRHAFGSIAINQATIVQVQAWMGHADVQTTMKYMYHRSRAGDARLLFAAFRPKKKPTRRKKTTPKATKAAV